VEDNLCLEEQCIDILAKGGFRVLFLFLFQLVELLRCGIKEVSICQHLLNGVRDFLHHLFVLGVLLGMLHHFVEPILQLLPCVFIPKGTEQTPSVPDRPIQVLVGVDIFLHCVNRLIGRSRVSSCITLDQQSDGRHRIRIVVSLSQFCHSGLQSMDKRRSLIP